MSIRSVNIRQVPLSAADGRQADRPCGLSPSLVEGKNCRGWPGTTGGSQVDRVQRTAQRLLGDAGRLGTDLSI
jgi:hypothetical protein